MSDAAPKKTSGLGPNGDAVQGFIDKLGALPAGDHVVHGMVKAADAPGGLMLAHVGDCDHWVYIAASAIQKITDTGRVTCLGHSHTTADIQLKDPTSDLEMAFAGIANLHRQALAKVHSLPTRALIGDPCPPGFHLGRDQFGNLSCQPGP
jgi:hypothetical protein